MLAWAKYPLVDPAAEPEAFIPVDSTPAKAEIIAPPASSEPVQVPRMLVRRGDWKHEWHDGEKFYGGFGPTILYTPDHWTLRQRSAQLFKTNLYARGLIRRLATNEINVGLHLEAIPEEALLGVEEDGLAEWSELVENRFRLWEENKHLCDHRELQTFGELQAQARMEALISGDVLIMLSFDQRTRLPRVRLIDAGSVRTPLGKKAQRGHRIEHGVELDDRKRHVAFWVVQSDGTSKRIPAYGEKSGRRIAWLVYGTEKRLDDVRGEPLLSLVLQSLREVDRYRDSTQRKAVINSMLAMFVKKDADKPGTRPFTAGGGPIRRDAVTVTDTDGTERTFKTSDLIPGLVIEELNPGEEPVAFNSNGTDEKFGAFEEAIIQAIAWANEVPPEILRLTFSNNYSASQAAINEYKTYLNKFRTNFGKALCAPIYEEWLISEVSERRIEAPELLAARRDPTRYDVYGAWIRSDWAGQIKPAVDLSKLVVGYEKLCDNGFITRDRATRELTGMKHSKVVKRLKLENEQLSEARTALAPVPEPNEAPAPDELEGEDERDENREDDRARPGGRLIPLPTKG